MDKREAIVLAKQYLQLVKKSYSVNQAFVFGSFAKGNFHDDSDIDIAVIMDQPGDMIQAQIDMMKMRRKINLRIEPHPFAFNDFESSNPVAYEIMKHGIAI